MLLNDQNMQLYEGNVLKYAFIPKVRVVKIKTRKFVFVFFFCLAEFNALD